MVKFAAQVGWKDDMVNVITQGEGTFSIVCITCPIASTFLCYLYSQVCYLLVLVYSLHI